MLLKKGYQWVIIAGLVFVLAGFSCKKANENAEAIEKPPQSEAEAIADSGQAKDEFMLLSGMDDLRESRSEIDERLEQFFTLLQKKEKALVDRENTIAELELALGLKADKLNKKETSLRYQQYLSWFIFLAGVIALISGILIARRKKIVPEKKAPISREDKNAYLDKMAKQVGEWERNIEALKKKAEKAKSEVKTEYFAQIDTLKQKKDAAGKKLADLQAAGDDVWEDLQSVVETAWDDMKKSLKSAGEKLK